MKGKLAGFCTECIQNFYSNPVIQFLLNSCCYRPQGKVMFSQVSVCPQSASWRLVHYLTLLQRGRYASYWNAVLFLYCFSIFCGSWYIGGFRKWDQDVSPLAKFIHFHEFLEEKVLKNRSGNPSLEILNLLWEIPPVVDTVHYLFSSVSIKLCKCAFVNVKDLLRSDPSDQ